MSLVCTGMLMAKKIRIAAKYVLKEIKKARGRLVSIRNIEANQGYMNNRPGVQAGTGLVGLYPLILLQVLLKVGIDA